MMGLQGWCALGSVRKLGQRERPWDRLRVAMKQPVGSILRCGLGVPERSGGKLACCVLRGGSGGNTTLDEHPWANLLTLIGMIALGMGLAIPASYVMGPIIEVTTKLSRARNLAPPAVNRGRAICPGLGLLSSLFFAGFGCFCFSSSTKGSRYLYNSQR